MDHSTEVFVGIGVAKARNAQRTREEDDSRLHSTCSRARWLHVVRGQGGANRLNSAELSPRAPAGAEPRQEDSRQTLCGRHRRRPQ
jgi:hypothetical protein